MGRCDVPYTACIIHKCMQVTMMTSLGLSDERKCCHQNLECITLPVEHGPVVGDYTGTGTCVGVLYHG
jgi:hypothetical protein